MYFFLSFFMIFCQGICFSENSTLLIPDTSFELTRYVIEEDEIKIVENLIVATEAQLKKQQDLKELMIHFQKQKEAFIQGNQTKTQATKLVRSARQIYEVITVNHFDHLFAKDYLDELQFFSSIAGKTAINRP